jgi:hypothetical protein
MNAAKIKNFEMEHPGTQFPWFHSLDLNETKQVLDDLKSTFGVPESKTTLELVVLLDSMAEDIAEFNAESDTFELRGVLYHLGISPLPRVFINWYRFDQIDVMNLDALAEWFDDIWYPSADDIDVFDSTYSWIISISHSGNIKSLVSDKSRMG